MNNTVENITSANRKINLFLFILFFSFFCITHNELKAQLTKKVLFLGNSYTSVNNLPQLVHDVALSAGDTLAFDSYAPGGYQLMNHSVDATSQNKIMSGGWDYVVIQGQSQEPITYSSQFSNGGADLYNLVKQYNACAVTMPYMTWGRKNGDASNCASFPVMCTYEGMDTTIRDRYLDLTEFINGEVSPVSVVWKYIRQNHPNIELYQSDESHPSAAGSYAAACCFYTMIFKKDPTLITFNSVLNSTDATNIKNAVKTIVFDNLQDWDFKLMPVSAFSFQTGAGTNEVIFHPTNAGVQQTYFWDFGDGNTSSAVYPTHAYLTDGTYTVSLTTTNCNLQGTYTSFTDTVIQFCNHTPTVFTSQPWLCKYDTLRTQTADAYQWYANGIALPETGQYLANYAQYAISGFSVIATVNGCAELSEMFTETPQWSGYYFDGMGDPCEGDTVAFAVLHINGLSGTEIIRWYKNDTLLQSMNDEDTLLISSPGNYECKVIDSNSDCPLDTTSAALNYECTTAGIKENKKEMSWNIYPNPASEILTVKFADFSGEEIIRIYNGTGRLISHVKASSSITQINVSDLPAGLYFILPQNNKAHPLKFIKQ